MKYAHLGLWLLVLATGSPAAFADIDRCGAEIVAAFDIGSGTTRMHLAKLDPCSELPLRRLISTGERVDFAADLGTGSNAKFSHQIIVLATNKMAGLVAQANSEGAQVLLGVATEAFRRADNGRALLDDWQRAFGIEIDIIGQREEGRLAYRLAEHIAPEAEKLLVWDIGAGSQQLVWRDAVTGDFRHFDPNLASVTFRDRAVAALGRPQGMLSPNPIAADEVPILVALIEEWIADQRPDDLPTLLNEKVEVIGLGGVHGASVTGQVGVALGEVIARDQVANALAGQLGRDDTKIGGGYADTDVTNLVLVHTLMGVYGIERYRSTRGDLGEAILVSCLHSRQHSDVLPRPPGRLRSDCLRGGR